MNGRQFLHNSIGSLGFIAVAQIVKFIKINIVLGSYNAFFSFNNCLLPLSGAFFGFTGASLVMLGKMALGMLLFGGLFPLSHLAFYIPGFFAALYWTSSSIMIRCIVPIICMILFLVHPVGGHVWIYAMYWWIPVILYFIKKNHLFTIALGSTFVAHAVGSVIWLYTVPMVASAWLALMPVVIIERLLFAIGMVALYKCAHSIKHVIPGMAKLRRFA